MTYGEKFKEVFGYYPDCMPCPENAHRNEIQIIVALDMNVNIFGILGTKNMNQNGR